MSNCTPCTPANNELPIFCDPNPATDTAKRLLVEDEAFCQKALTSPTAYSTLIWDGSIKWAQSSGWQSISSAYFAKAGDKLSVNTSGGVVQITLPATPNQFDEITFADHYNAWGTNNVIVKRNGSLIEGVTQDLYLNTSWPTQITLRYEGSTWRVFSIV
jgi:hypothetical protein